MNVFPRSAGRYVLLIVILFAIVAVASRFIIAHLCESFPQPEHEQVIGELSVAILALTFGCLFLAGALGLWAIRSASEIEGRRRIGRFVDAMDYLSDGLLALDRAGRITGSNPAARRMAPRVMPSRVAVGLRDIFPQLTEADMERLLDANRLRELERDCVYTGGLRTLRFRSQPAEGVILVLVSDVTDLRSHEIRRRQIAQLQLIGRIAAGMAHDFNNILCAISGHAALLARRPDDPEIGKNSLNIILEETEKGSLLSRQLLGLSRSGDSDVVTQHLSRDVEDAAALLRVALSPSWSVKTLVEGKYPAMPFTPVQVEQVILNLGLLLADAQARAGTMTITLQQPGAGQLLDVGDRFAAVIMVSAAAGPEGRDALPPAVSGATLAAGDELGVILSVVNSMVEQAGGRVDQFVASAGVCLYRVCLPHLDVRGAEDAEDGPIGGELDRYVARWRVLLGGSGPELEKLQRRLERRGASVVTKANVVSLLAYFEASQAPDAIVVDKRILGLEADGLLKAMLKLCPRVGVVVLCHDPSQEASELSSLVVFAPYGLDPERLVRAMIEAKGQSLAAGPTPKA